MSDISSITLDKPAEMKSEIKHRFDLGLKNPTGMQFLESLAINIRSIGYMREFYKNGGPLTAIDQATLISPFKK